MNIRPKVIALVAGLFGALIVMEVGIQERGIMPSFSTLERADARTSMTRVDYALDRTLEGLESTASDWADWGELYQFMQNRNPGFLATYTTPVVMAPLKVNLLLLVDRDGRVVFSAARELGSDRKLSIDLAAQPALSADFPWRQDLTTGRTRRGLVSTNAGVMLLAAAPILDGSGKGSSLGLAILGRLLTAEQLREIGTQAQATVSMLQPAVALPDTDLREAGTLTQVFRPYVDVYERPVMTLRVDVPRNLTAQAQSAVAYSLAYLVAAAVAVLILSIMLLNRLVLAPIARVTRHAVAMGAGGDLTARLDVAGNDELSRLACEFDRMVERVAESRRKLVDQSFNAGYAELAKGIMHHLESTMALLGTHLSQLVVRLYRAPVVHVGAAARQLAQAPNAPGCTGLAQSIKDGCAEITAAVAAAQAHVAVMERQASIVSVTLAEQRDVANNGRPLQDMRLP